MGEQTSRVPDSEAKIERHIIACPPKDASWFKRYGVNHHEPEPGSEEVKCPKCGAACWLGPKQKQLQAKTPGTSLLCFECTMKLHIQMLKEGAEITLENVGGVDGKYYRNEHN